MKLPYQKLRFFSLLLFTGLYVTAQPVFRWDVKTLTDGSAIDWNAKLETAKHANFASIEGLTAKNVQFTSCHDVGLHTRRSDEMRIVKMRVRLISVMKEGNDDDYHVVMQSLTNSSHYMVAEIPDPATARLQGAQYAGLRQRFTELRAQVKTLLGENITGSPKNFPPNIQVKIYGVPFWDCKHGNHVTGASVDCRELHPVFEID